MPILTWLRMAPYLVILALIAWSVHLSDSRDKWKANARAAYAKLDQLAEQSRETRKATERVITQYKTITVPKVERIVERIESAPLPGNCRTPNEVLQADL